jgi:hypothetical protein
MINSVIWTVHKIKAWWGHRVCVCESVLVCKVQDPDTESYTEPKPDDGSSRHLWNVGKLIPVYTALQPTLAAVRTPNPTNQNQTTPEHPTFLRPTVVLYSRR